MCAGGETSSEKYPVYCISFVRNNFWDAVITVGWGGAD